MSTIGIRELRQDASGAIRRVVAGESITVTDRGRPVARLVPASRSGLAHLLETGAAPPPLAPLSELPALEGHGDVTTSLRALRDEERF